MTTETKAERAVRLATAQLVRNAFDLRDDYERGECGSMTIVVVGDVRRLEVARRALAAERRARKSGAR